MTSRVTDCLRIRDNTAKIITRSHSSPSVPNLQNNTREPRQTSKGSEKNSWKGSRSLTCVWVREREGGRIYRKQHLFRFNHWGFSFTRFRGHCDLNLFFLWSSLFFQLPRKLQRATRYGGASMARESIKERRKWGEATLEIFCMALPFSSISAEWNQSYTVSFRKGRGGKEEKRRINNNL